ncbi:MAG: hypothetical protein KAG37_03225 [Flavobacteriales bacterium]|nr:hypothetical protein [Flavobacteriales bacterium]
MRRLKLLISSLLLGQMAFAGGMVTNTNQSAAYIRMLARDASTDVDAVFYNPAGLTKLADGFYVQLNNQTVGQTRVITSTNSSLNNNTYNGDVFVPFLPSLFAVYKTGDWAFSGGFAVVGGGGSAKYDTGLPSFEYQIASIPGQLNDLKQIGYDVSGYDVNLNFEGTSAYLGFQAGASYAINDMISVYAGARYVSVMNTYKGDIKDIQLTVNGSKMLATDAFDTFAGTLNGLSAQTKGAGDSMQQIIDLGAGSYTLDELLGAGQLTQPQYDQLTGGLAQLGVADPGSMPAATAQGTYYGASAQFGATAGAMTATGAQMGDKAVDVEQTGSGFTPIIGANIALMDDKLNIGLKYEFKTEMTIANKTTKDDTGMFPDKQEYAADMPAFLSVGVDYMVADNFKVSIGTHYYWDKSADYGKNGHNDDGSYKRGDNSDFIDGNSYEIALGLQYDINEKIGLSGGYLYGNTSPALTYQNDLSYSLSTNTFSIGAVGHVSEKFDIDLGMLYTAYDPSDKEFDNAYGIYKETYDKSNWVVAVGFTYKFGGSSVE